MKLSLLKTVDDKFAELGFVKVRQGQHGASYERKNEKYGYTHCLDIAYKAGGRYLVQSYQKDVNSDGFNHSVGLYPEELKLAYKKIKYMRLQARRSF